MGGKVSIDIAEFDANISTLESKIAELTNDMNIPSEFEKTNIEPFTKDLQKVIQAKQLLSRYKEFIKKDSDVLSETGQDMVDNDKEIANAYAPAEMK